MIALTLYPVSGVRALSQCSGRALKLLGVLLLNTDMKGFFRQTGLREFERERGVVSYVVLIVRTSAAATKFGATSDDFFGWVALFVWIYLKSKISSDSIKTTASSRLLYV